MVAITLIVVAVITVTPMSPRTEWYKPRAFEFRHSPTPPPYPPLLLPSSFDLCWPEVENILQECINSKHRSKTVITGISLLMWADHQPVGLISLFAGAAS